MLEKKSDAQLKGLQKNASSQIPTSSSAQLTLQALATGFIPYAFSFGESTNKPNSTAYASLPANLTIGDARQLVESILLPQFVRSDQSVLIINNIAVPLESMEDLFLDYVLFVHALTKKYVLPWFSYLCGTIFPFNPFYGIWNISDWYRLQGRDH